MSMIDTVSAVLLIGWLLGMPRAQARERAHALLATFKLEDAISQELRTGVNS
jgi:hypothetical protein